MIKDISEYVGNIGLSHKQSQKLREMERKMMQLDMIKGTNHIDVIHCIKLMLEIENLQKEMIEEIKDREVKDAWEKTTKETKGCIIDLGTLKGQTSHLKKKFFKHIGGSLIF